MYLQVFMLFINICRNLRFHPFAKIFENFFSFAGINFIQALNSNVKVTTFNELLTSKNALQIIKNFDVILDCSDNVATRYLVNDACVIQNKPLVSGSALKFEGQLMVYNYQNQSSTYRCIYPTPPPAHTVTNCSDGGVLGVIPGIIGNIQALEAIKIIIDGLEPSFVDSMLIFDGIGGSGEKRIGFINLEKQTCICKNS